MDFAVKFAQVEKSLLSLPWKHHFKPLSLCVMVAMVVVRKMPNQILQEGVDVVLVVVASSHTCKKREIPEIYLRNFFWIFCKILG